MTVFAVLLPTATSLLVFFCLENSITGQNILWTDISAANLRNAADVDRPIRPQRFRGLFLDFERIKVLLEKAPAEADYLNGAPGILLEFPLPDGRFNTYEIWYAPVMAPELCAQFPEIRSYAGRSAEGDYLRFDVCPAGLHAMTLSAGNGSWFIDPYARGNTAQYMCYHKKDFYPPDFKSFNCQSEHLKGPDPLPAAADRVGSCGTLKTYRLALAATGEYTAYHGGTVGGALAAMNTTMTRVNGVYERDFSLRMTIIGNNSNIIYTNGATDPYTNDDGVAMLEQNQTNIDAVIMNANYDIGHVFSTGGGGVAYVGIPCVTSWKAKGVTGSSAPVGDPFDIDYVAHEMGHQWGTAHTQYNDCNRDDVTAVEPGSASTIMGYAGICPPDVQAHSDDYFSAASMAEIAAYIATATCSSNSSNGNSSPTCAALTNRSIPISTPFALTASGSDPNSDAITYCWEQMDAYTAPAQPMPPQSTNTTGPLFRSYSPTSSPTRYFPKLDDVLGNVNSDWEELPSIGRTMNFRVTVRDNRSGGGCSTERNVIITSESSAGPFVVTQPNSFVTWQGNSTQTVTWNVANTTASPVNCSTVDILLTTDQGSTFTTLVSNTANDGSQTVIVPNVSAPKCRIMVRSVNNVFYDVSDVDFSITIALPIELSDFTAIYSNKIAILRWTTASETDNLGFDIERSAGDAEHFEKIGFTPGAGTAHEYRFEDKGVLPQKKYYYRLHQVDFDGTGHYSPIRVITTGKTEGLTVYPNPARESFRLNLPDTATDAAVTLQIADATGRLVRTVEYRAGENVQIADLPDGVYRVNIPELVETAWFVKN